LTREVVLSCWNCNVSTKGGRKKKKKRFELITAGKWRGIKEERKENKRKEGTRLG